MNAIQDKSKQYLMLARKSDKRFRYLSAKSGERIQFSDALFVSHEADTPQELIQIAAANQYKITGLELTKVCEAVAREFIENPTEEQIKQASLPLLSVAKQAGIVIDPETIDRKYEVVTSATTRQQVEPLLIWANEFLRRSGSRLEFTATDDGKLVLDIPGYSAVSIAAWVEMAKQANPEIQFTVNEIY